MLQPSATYIADEESAPASQKVFSTASSGSNSALLASPPTSTISSTPSIQTDVVGSALAPFRGILRASVSRSGKATLSFAGRPVTSLAPGRYTIEANDADAHAGFLLRLGSRRPLTVTGVAFLGRRTQTLTLTDGSWSFFTLAGMASAFTVAG